MTIDALRRTYPLCKRAKREKGRVDRLTKEGSEAARKGGKYRNGNDTGGKNMLEIGRKGYLERTVTKDLSAKVWGSGAVDVFATPCLIALLEETAWRSVQDELEPGQATVGTKLDVAHIAATPIGMQVRCETELKEIDRKRLVFAVAAYDEAGKIAEGTHERFIVDVEKFQAKAYAKANREG